MRGNNWYKVLFSVTVFCFIFGLGIYQAEAHVFNSKRLDISSNSGQGTGKGPCAFGNSKGIALKSLSSGISLQGLGGSGSISGQVKDINGNPLANIQVQLSQGVDPNWADDQAWDWVASTNTDGSGNYQFNGLTERRYHLHIYEGQEAGGKHYITADQYQVQVMEGALTDNINFTLRQAGLVWGYVKNTDGTPISDAEVVARASYTYDGNSWHGTRTDANGRYELWLLPSPGEFYPIVVDQASTSGTTYKVYGGNSYISEKAGLDPASHGYTLLGSATVTHTFSGAHEYYIILAEPNHLVKVDAVQRANSSYLWSNGGWGNIDNWGNINGSAPNGNFTSINYQYMSQGAYMLFNPGPGSTGLTVYIVTDGRPADPVSYEAKNAPGLYQSTLAGVHGPDFSLNEGGKIYGRVVNEQGVGIKNAEMWASLWTNNGRVCTSCHTTDSDGYYTATNIPATDRAYVMAGNRIEQAGIKYGQSAGYVGPLSVTAGAATAAPDITLLVAGMITGQVIDENGVPVVGAEIEAWGYDINGYEADSEDAYTDAFGQYTLDYLTPGTYTVRAKKDSFTDGVKGSVVVASESQVDCDLVMDSTSQAATVSGKISNYSELAPQDTNGVPLPWHDENNYSNYGYPEMELIAFQGNVAYTDEDYFSIDKFIMGFAEPNDGYDDYFKVSTTETPGNYNFVLPAGEMTLAALSYLETEDGEYVVMYDWHTLMLTPGATFSNQDFTAPTNNGTLKGSISVPSGSSLKSGKTIILAFNENDSNPGLLDALAWPEFGTTYNFVQLPAGTYTIRAISDGFVTKVYEHVTVTEGQITTRNIEFAAGGTLAGTITDTSSAAVEGAEVKVVETGSFAMTGANGEYSINGLATGGYTVEISKSGYATATQQAVSVTDGATATLNVVLNSQVGTITGTVTATAGGANINGATVVAYNPADFSNKTATTVGGAYTITGLVYGDYVVAVNADGYETSVYTGSVTVNSPTTTGIDFSLDGIAPEFSVSSSVGTTTLSMTFYADVALDATPAFTVVTGDGALGTQIQVSATQWEVDYTVDVSDTVVEIKIEGGHNGQPGSATFSFEVSTNLLQTASTNVTNATGGETTMMGTQDNTSVYVPPFALAGTNDTTAVPLTIRRYGDPGDSVGGTNNQSVSAIYDFSFEDNNVVVEENHTITVTMSFVLPAGMTQQEFENTFVVRYFNVNTQQWQTDGISNVRINWNNYTVMFEVSHLSEFGVFLPGNDVPSGWNLISLPQQPADTAIESVLSSISGKYASVWAFMNGNWKVYDPANPDFSDLLTMEAGWGYWIKMTEAASLSVSGTTPSDTIPLVSGWNLVGYNSTNSQDIADALASIEGKYVSVWAFMNGGWKVYDPANPDFSDLLTMEPNYGYWINTTEACTWTLP